VAQAVAVVAQRLVLEAVEQDKHLLIQHKTRKYQDQPQALREEKVLKEVLEEGVWTVHISLVMVVLE
jgi:hypothetical protein